VDHEHPLPLVLYQPRYLEHHKEQMHRHACTCTQVLAYTPAVLARTRECTHTHTNTHTHTHTNTHTYTHKHAYTRTHARKQARTYVHTRTHTCTSGRACTHTHTHLHARALRNARTHAHKHACTQSSVLVQHFGQGDMLFYRLACVHICVWHRTTGIAL
jgi:hypothetical protein